MRQAICTGGPAAGLPLCLAALLLPVAAAAQTTAPAAPAPAAAASAAPATSFVLREIRLPPTEAVPQADLRAALQPYVGKGITNSDLARMLEAVRQLYEDRGLGLAAIGLPTQDVTQGTLALAIVEPRVNRLSVAGSEMPPLPEARVRAVLRNFGVDAGAWLDVHQLDRAMFVLNDMPGVSAKATLGAAGEEGAYDMTVEVEPRRAWDAQVEADNHGSDTTGKYRLGGVLRWNNPLRIGDNADLRVMVSDGGGVVVGRLGYEAPLGLTPARIGAGYSRVDYELGDEFAVLGVNGTADVVDASVSYPIVRSRGRNLVARLGLEHKSLEDRVEAGDVVSRKRIQAAGLGLSYEGRDRLGGGGFVGAALQVRHGRLRFRSEQDAIADASGPRTAGSFSKLEWQASRLQAVTRELSLHTGLSGQFASRNLDGAEKVTLGGPKGVRGYPKAEGASDEAAILSAELRWWLNPRWTVYALADVARSKALDDPGTAGAGNKRTLKAAGFGVYFSDPRLFTLTASVARRGDEVPLTEADQPEHQFFMHLSRAF